MTRISTCCVLLNTTDFTPDTYRVKRVSLFEAGLDRYSSILRIVAESDNRFDLPFNQFSQSHVFGFMRSAQRGGYLESWFSQNCWPVFWFIDVSSAWVWFNPPSPFFLTHLRSCYQAVVSLAGLKAIRFGYLEYVVEGMSMKEKMENACFWNDYAFVYVHMRCLDFYFEFFLASFDHLFGWILSRKRKFIFFKFFYWVKKIG